MRNIALAAAIGTSISGDSYNISNQIPTMVLLLLGGGTVAAVFLPRIVAHAKVSQQTADEYATVILIMAAALGGAITVGLVAFRGDVIRLFAGQSWDTVELETASQLALWCLPQLALLAIYAVLSQILNARQRFSQAAWFPGISNLSVIVACATLVVSGEPRKQDLLSQVEVFILGSATLGGCILQVGFLFVAARRSGFRPRLPRTLRTLGLKATAKVGTLALLSTAIYQVANMTAAAVATRAGAEAAEVGLPGRGFTAYYNAQSIILTVQAVVAASLATVLLERLSHHFANRDSAAAAAVLSDGVLRVGSALIPISAILVALGPQIGVALFSNGDTGVNAGQFIGVAISIFALGLVPYALQILLLRPFYARGDGLTPLYSTGVVCSILMLGAIASAILAPATWAVLGIVSAYVLGYWVDLPLKLRRLVRQYDLLVSTRVLRVLGRACLVAVLGGSLAFMSARLLEAHVSTSQPAAWLSLTIGLVLFSVVYLVGTLRTEASPIRLSHWLRR